MKAIPHIGSLNQIEELAKDIQAFYKTQEITLTLGTKTFEELFSCKKSEHTLILIVAVANSLSHEKNVYGMPYYQ